MYYADEKKTFNFLCCFVLYWSEKFHSNMKQENGENWNYFQSFDAFIGSRFNLLKVYVLRFSAQIQEFWACPANIQMSFRCTIPFLGFNYLIYCIGLTHISPKVLCFNAPEDDLPSNLELLKTQLLSSLVLLQTPFKL